MDRKQLLKLYLDEDLQAGDVTTDPIFNDEKTEAQLICKENGIIAGLNVFADVFSLVDQSITIDFKVSDGQIVENGQLLAVIRGTTKSILHAERVALNLLQRMSGVASLTNEYVKCIASQTCKIYDTRKTTPLMRTFEKEAVVIGGGCNHRYNLGDQILIKDNHIAAAGSITNAVKLTKLANSELLLEVECESIEDVKECIETNMVDIIMLDNMSIEMMEKCVDLIGDRTIIEASGNMTLAKISQVSQIGVDRISVGNLTHSYKSLDISLKIR